MQTMFRSSLLLALTLVLLCALRSEAAGTFPVTNDTPDDFNNALASAISAGGGTISIPSPILFTDGGSYAFDGQSEVTVDGGGTTNIFIVTNGTTLSLSNFTITGGFGTVGGAIFVGSTGTNILVNCLLSNNVALGLDGFSAITNSPTNSPVIGGNGGSGTPGQSVAGGAVFNLGTLFVFNCQFVTNSAIGGNGGNGAPGVSGTTSGGNGGRGGNGGSAFGAGIFDLGFQLIISNSTFSGNFAQGGAGGAGGTGGGGIFSGLTASGGFGGSATGGGLQAVDPNATIWGSTFASNTAAGGNGADGGTSSGGNGQSGRRGGGALGGGIVNAGILTITNSTFFENIAAGGAGGNGGNGAAGGNGGTGGTAIGGSLYNTGLVLVVNCTFSQGAAIGGTNGTPGSGAVSGRNGSRGASQGGNIANVARKKKGIFILANSIVGVNLAGKGAFGSISDGGYNISADKSIPFKSQKKGGTSLMNTNPMLGDLSDNGGPTETIALPTNSPAVGFVNQTNAHFAPPGVDQRGEPRTNTFSDAGAFELNPNELLVLVQPQSTNVPAGSNAVFSITVGGPGPLGFQWYFSPSNSSQGAIAVAANALTNADVTTSNSTSILTITNVQSTNIGFYLAVVTNSSQAVTSKVAQLTLTIISNSPPIITSISPAPPNEVVNEGDTANFSVTATGTAPLQFQWTFASQATDFTNIITIAGATNSTLSFTNAQFTNQGIYQVTVTNNFGSTNAAFTLFVNPTNSTGSNAPSPSGFQSAPVEIREIAHLKGSLGMQEKLPGAYLAALDISRPSRFEMPDVPTAVIFWPTPARSREFVRARRKEKRAASGLKSRPDIL